MHFHFDNQRQKSNMKFLPFLGMLSSTRLIVANEYCHICQSHTMCRYKENVIPDDCMEYRKIELTIDNKTDIVDIHNNLRNFVASGGYINESDIHLPEASAMMYLRWSDELAVMAQRWADQCLADENRDQCRDTEEFSVGQTVITEPIATPEKPPPFPELFMARWGVNFQYFSSKDVLEFDASKSEDIGKYSQLIWDTTEYVGCGLMTFKYPYAEDQSPDHMIRLVCNYGPAGNIESAPIYKIGQPCSLCISKRCHPKYRALCLSDWKTQMTYEKNKLKEDIRKIMMERYNMFRNGEECFCEDKYEVDHAASHGPPYLRILVPFVFIVRCCLVEISLS
ncbi:venom allergen 3-like [Coccinella septempunctata]|uniref:venom allergen 3-like n=1 Tax=Coccinella septempunctata TaxID=41139 RepID=UPI001D0675FB|nr:venom allergen 3-like [Coccinella septempunctata]